MRWRSSVFASFFASTAGSRAPAAVEAASVGTAMAQSAHSARVT
jgi:hypothetical protein